MPHVPKRPPALAHLSDEAASVALQRHFGDFVAAAKDLGVKRTDLRKLSWHNPRILRATHERMELFHSGVKGKIIAAICSPSAKRRRWGYDAMADAIEFRDSPFASARAPLPPSPARVAAGVRLILQQKVEAELARERESEIEADGRREQEGAGLEVEFETSRRQERETVVARRSPTVGLSLTPAAQGRSLWPSGIRRPSRGGWR